MNLALWIIQGVLAAMFLFAGGVKLAAPVDQLMKGIPPQLSAGFLRFVGVCEVAGALGLILPRLLKIRPGLTPLAAVCLIGIMIGAVVVTLMTASAGQAAIPAIVGCILAFVAYGRMRLAP